MPKMFSGIIDSLDPQRRDAVTLNTGQQKFCKFLCKIP